MKRIFSISLVLLIAACSSQLPAPSRSAVASNYSQAADANAPTATLTVETAEPVTLLSTGSAGAAQIICPATFDAIEWAKYSQGAIQNGDGTPIERYTSLHIIPNEVKVDGDRVSVTDAAQGFATAYTDDGHEGAVCSFELKKLRVVASR